MAEDYVRQIQQRLRSGSFEDIEEAVRIADAHNDVAWGARTRDHLIHAATFGGKEDKALVAFVWLMAQTKRNPELIERAYVNLDWKFKWIMASVADFPTVSRGQIEDLFREMAERYTSRGLSLRAVESLRCRVRRLMGDRTMTAEDQRRWMDLPRDGSEDCPACTINEQVEHLVFVGELAKALRVGKPVFEGRMRCAEVPANTCSTMLMPLFKAGRLEEADAMQRRVQRDVVAMDSMTEEVGQHLRFLVATRQLPRAARMFDRTVRRGMTCGAPRDRLEFIFGAHALFLAMERAGRKEVRLAVTDELKGLEVTGGRCAVPAVTAWFHAEAKRLAEAFDRRNGNSYYTEQLAENEALVAGSKPLPEKLEEGA